MLDDALHAHEARALDEHRPLERGEHFDSVEAVIARAQGLTALKGTMLVKGSRFMRMERVVEHLVAGEAACC